MEYFITTNTHLTQALMACGQKMTFTRSGKKVYFHFEKNAILLDLVERYEKGTLADGLFHRHADATHTVQRIVKGKI